MNANPYRALPSVDRVLRRAELAHLRTATPGVAAALVRQAIATARGAVARGSAPPGEAEIAETVLGLAALVLEPSLRPVINATGVIIHTNLGRAPLSRAAVQAMAAVSGGYSNLEFDLVTGERGSRHAHLEALLCQLTGAEAALAVNNNAAALLLALTALVPGKQVIISRGQAVEIGGGFRIPDVMQQSGARLVDVGTTNRTYLRDYKAALGPETGAVMRVHASNFRVSGFTSAPPLADLARLAHEHGVLLLDDIGSGCLLDTTQFGLAAEPTVVESLAAGADLCLFSGDKLLGGPQAGIAVGRAHLIAAMRRHPLARALRMDKGSIAALHATLLHYLRGEALQEVPVWRMISTPLERVARRARRWARAIGPPAQVRSSRSMVGGGSLPGESLPTKVVAVAGEGSWLVETARRLRAGSPAVAARIEDGSLVFDPRTVLPGEGNALITAARAAVGG